MSGRLIATIVFTFGLARLAGAATTALPEQYRKWLDEEVVYIITDEERKAFLSISEPLERERFIQEFWNVRGGQEYKDEHYRRLDYANRNFSRHSTGPGWRTDMGRAWILFGKPISRHPFTGYGQIYPLELWSYDNKTGSSSLPPFFDLLFYIPEDIGEYKFYRPYIDGPMKLVRGSNFRTNADVYRFLQPLGGDVAHAAFSLIPNDPIDTTTFQPELSGDMLIARIENFANTPQNVRRIREQRALRAVVKSYVVVDQHAPPKTVAVVLADPEGQYWLDYAMLVDDPKYGKLDRKTSSFASSFRYRLLTESGKLITEDSEDRSYPCSTPPSGFCPFVVTNRLPVVPGSYRLVMEIVNTGTGERFSAERVIKADALTDNVGIAGPLLSGEVKPARPPDVRVPFQYFGVQFLPAIGGTLTVGADLRLLFEVQKSHPTALRIEYVLGSVTDRDLRKSVSDKLQASEFANGTLLRSKTIPLAGLPAGDYRLAINVRGLDSEQALASVNTPVRVVAEQDRPALVALENSKVTATRPMASYIRGLASLAQGAPSATDYLRSALDLNPKNSFAAQYLVDAYFQRRQFAPIVSVYDRFGVGVFETSPDCLAQLSASLWATGDRPRAREVLDRGRRLFPNDPALRTASAIENRH